MKIYTILVVASLVLLPMSAATAAEHTHTHRHTAKAVSFAIVPNPEVPKSMTFAGVKVDLDREDMYERMDRELSSLVYGHGNTLLTIKRANKYFPVMAPILRSNGIPEDLLYLACVESYLNPRAYSVAKAAGIWQFIPATARQYGLEVSDEVDERYNLEKATAAACRYLKSAYTRYGNWESVMASYNGGMARISGELSKQGVNTSFDLYLTDETSRYVFRIMAMKAVMENAPAFDSSSVPTSFINRWNIPKKRLTVLLKTGPCGHRSMASLMHNYAMLIRGYEQKSSPIKMVKHMWSRYPRPHR